MEEAVEDYQERSEDSKKDSKTKNNRVANPLIEDRPALKETGLPETPIFILRDLIMIILS